MLIDLQLTSSRCDGGMVEFMLYRTCNSKTTESTES